MTRSTISVGLLLSWVKTWHMCLSSVSGVTENRLIAQQVWVEILPLIVLRGWLGSKWINWSVCVGLR